jgi:tetratricopeptide (TPR) repeat protein
VTNSDAGDRRVANVVSGVVAGSVVQAGEIHGGVHVHRHVSRRIVPRQLRPTPAHFTGRRAELAELDRAAADARQRDGPALVVISGPGGVGKSALALRWLHGVSDRYPDGQLYVELGSDGPAGPESLTSVLGQFLRALGVAGERIPAEAGEAAALFRSVTAGKRVALLVENATSAAQVRAILPASCLCMVVATSRWRLGGLAMDGAGFVTLAPLEISTGTELLTHTLGRPRVSQEPEAVARLVQLCEGLPIALVIVGARLAGRPRWPVARVVRDLDDEQSRLRTLSLAQDISVQGVFDVSYRGLSASTARAYRWLGLHPGRDFRTEAAAAALRTSPEDAADLLETLIDANLLNGDENRYSFHDLVRLHAFRCAEHEDSADTRDTVVRRVVEYYLRASAAADRVIIPLEWRLGPVFQQDPDAGCPTYDTGESALDGMEVELPNLMATLRLAVKTGLDELVWQLCEAMYSVFLYRKHFPDWLAAYQLGIGAADRCGNQGARSRMHHHRGVALHNLGRSDDALAEGAAALEAARAAGVREAESEAMDLIGMANRSRGRYEEAIDVLRQAVDLDRQAGLRRNEALSRRLLGQALSAAGRIDEAIAELVEARRQAAALPDVQVEANIMVRLAEALTQAGRAADAVGIVRDAWAVLGELGSPQYRAQVLAVWGAAAARLGNLADARAYLVEARDLYLEIGAPHANRVQGVLETVERRISEAGS